MPQRRILLLDGNELRAYHWRREHIIEESSFTSQTDGLAAFRHYAIQHRKSNFFLLTDVAEESFHCETIPYSIGADRRAMIDRKLKQHFYGTPYTTTLSLGRETTGRRDERVLFYALPRQQAIDPWLNVLQEEDTQIAGVFSIPLLVPSLAKKIHHLPPRFVLVTLSRQGIRQTFFEGGKLRFSRLTALPREQHHEAGIVCATETRKLFQYLIGQRIVPRDQPLPIWILVRPEDQEEFARHCSNIAELPFHFIDIGEIAQNCGLKQAPGTLTDSTTDTLFSHLLALSPSPQQFAPKTSRYYYRIWQLRFATLSVMTIVLIGCLLFSGEQLINTYQLNTQQRQLEHEALVYRQAYTELARKLPHIPASSEHLRQLMQNYQVLRVHSAAPAKMFMGISRSLDVMPKITLDKLEWMQADFFKTDTTAPHAPSPTQSEVSVIMHGHLPANLANDPRGQLNLINDFVTTLETQASFNASIVHLPVNVASEKSIHSLNDDTRDTETPSFAIRITQRKS